MPAIRYLKKRIGHTYLVWFQNSNLYIQLEEPAWFVFRKTVKRYNAATIASEFSIRYGISSDESLAFVRELRSEIEKMNQLAIAPDNINQVSDELSKYKFVPYSTHYYCIGNRTITFSYETRLFEYYLHPLIAHFETTPGLIELPIFELFSYQGRIIFRHNGMIRGSWNKEETHLLKGLIFMYLINTMHNKTDADWLMTIHASAITNGKKTILFSAPPGKGKTTIAALLQTRGYPLISDDFVPVDRNSLNAYPFPIAMSVKQGSMDLLSTQFPDLEQKPINYISPEKAVRYLPPNHKEVIAAVYPVKELIFIEYNSLVDFVWEKLDPVKAIKLLLDQTWVLPAPENAALLFDWILRTNFYQLTYSNNEKALDAITNLFGHD